MKKVAIIGTVGVPGKYGGFETLAHQLVNNLKDEYKINVYCSGKAYPKNERQQYFNGARLYYLPFKANGIQSIIYDMVSMFYAIFRSDVLIVLGVSGGLMIPFIRLFTRKKVIVNIDGMEWRRAKWNRIAKAFLKLSEKVAVKWSHADITDNAAIKRYTSIHYKTLSQLIEYGADHTQKVTPTKQDLKTFPFLRMTYAFKVARIEPENNIHVILKAFSRLKQTLVIVGNWEHSNYGINLKQQYRSYSHIHLLDPIYEQEKLDLLRSNCFLYVHGHSAGGTNPSLVEAMYLNLPIMAFDCSYNRATTENKAIFFKDDTELKQAIKSVKIEDLIKMKAELGEIAQKRYTWKAIARKYANLIYSFDYNYKKQSINSHFSRLDKQTLLSQNIAHLQYSKLYFEEL